MLENVKKHIASLTGAIGLIATIGGAVLYVENNYAHARDMNDVIQTQTSQIKLYKSLQLQNLMFQLEYYDDRINMLKKLQQTNRQTDIDNEILSLMQRREMVRRQIIAVEDIK